MKTPSISTAFNNPIPGIRYLKLLACTCAVSVASFFIPIAEAGTVNVRVYGATGNGATDDTVAIQNAFNAPDPDPSTPYRVYFPAGTYLVNAGSLWKFNAPVEIYGDGNTSIIKSDGQSPTLRLYAQTNLHHLRFVNVTTPYVVNRFLDGKGYQPTPNDVDVWSGLTAAQQNQNIGPQIWAVGDNHRITNITGEFLSIILWDSSNSVVQDCTIRAGKNWAGGIVFWGSEKVSTGNIIYNNTVRYASYSGIVLQSCTDSLVWNNRVYKCGESGYKTWQGIRTNSDNTTLDLRCLNITFNGNLAEKNYYDGFDVTCDTDHSGQYDTQGTNLNYNLARYNYRVGFYADGQSFVFNGNTSEYNKLSGFYFRIVNNSEIKNNIARYNNQSNVVIGVTDGQHEFGLWGSQLTIRDNQALRAQRRSDSYGYGIFSYFYGNNLMTGNTLTNCSLGYYY